ncbi:MAG: LCP family protein [Patescibacteria group bacterium]
MVNDIDLLEIAKENGGDHAHYRPYPRPPQRMAKRLLKFLIYLTAVAFVVLFVFTSRVLMSADNKTFSPLTWLNQFKHLAQTSDNLLKGEENGRINVLLLGMAGKNHEGSYLTDTIILASIAPASGEIALLSLPRDLIVPIEGYGFRKINNINAFAESEQPGSGGLAVSQALSRVLDIPIDYYLRADFEGFVTIIDELGGIEVEVENTLDDPRYPIAGREEDPNYDSRFEYLHLEKGWQKMDGELALKYVRSRHAGGVEGSDFARSRRQQKVLQAVKDKVLNLHILFKPRLINNILTALEEHVSTNFKVWEMVKLWSIIKDANPDKIISKVLNNANGGLLVDAITPDGAYILQPRTGDYAEIQYLVKNIFSNAPPKQTSEIRKEETKLEIQNGTWINGLGQRLATDLEPFGFTITSVHNASKQNYEESIIFDLSYGVKMQSLTTLKEKTGARVNYGLPDWLLTELKEQNEGKINLVQPDFILIIGRDADKTQSGAENKEE